MRVKRVTRNYWRVKSVTVTCRVDKNEPLNSLLQNVEIKGIGPEQMNAPGKNASCGKADARLRDRAAARPRSGEPKKRYCHEGGNYFPWSPVAAG